jgi:hypothetical protein
VKDYCAGLGDRELADAAYALEDVFLGKKRALCKQAAWMGRGCFSQANERHYLVAKGVGPGPGSEQMRVMLDETIRRRGEGRGGCLRLDTESYYPLLVQFQQRAGGWNVFDTRPEGFSMFSFLYREAEAALILRNLDLRAVTPLLLMRNRLDPPWRTHSRISLESYLKKRLPAAIQKHISLREGQAGMPFNFTNQVYLDMDGGVLIRNALSPYRVANLHHTITENDRAGLEFLTGHMLRQFGFRDSSSQSIHALSLSFSAELARIAATLFSEGIIHGQLGLHHQNITLAAEIADFDELIFVRAITDATGVIPFPESQFIDKYVQFSDDLRKIERQYGVNIIPVLTGDYQEFGGMSYKGLDLPRLSAFMLRQLFDLYSHSLLTADLLSRNLNADLQRAGTVLSDEQIGELQTVFVENFINALVNYQALSLLRWSLSTGFDYLLHRLLNRLHRRTFYGWTSFKVPVDQLIAICDADRLKQIRKEASGLFSCLQNIGRVTFGAGC